MPKCPECGHVFGNNELEREIVSNPVPCDLWRDYIKMRLKIKKPMTDRAETLAIRKLKQMKSEGHDVIKVVEQSIFNAWQGLFPVRDDRSALQAQINRPPAFRKNFHVSKEQAEANLREAERRGIKIGFLRKVN